MERSSFWWNGIPSLWGHSLSMILFWDQLHCNSRTYVISCGNYSNGRNLTVNEVQYDGHLRSHRVDSHSRRRLRGGMTVD